MYAGIFALQGASLALPLLTSGHDTGATVAIVVFIALYGLGFGLPELIRGVTVAEFYGTASYASINGVLGLFVTIARAAGPAAAGVAVTLLGGYTALLVGAAVAALAGSATLLAAARAHERESAFLAPVPVETRGVNQAGESATGPTSTSSSTTTGSSSTRPCGTPSTATTKARAITPAIR